MEFIETYKKWLIEMMEETAQKNHKACERKDLITAARWFGELSAYKSAYIRIDVIQRG